MKTGMTTRRQCLRLLPCAALAVSLMTTPAASAEDPEILAIGVVPFEEVQLTFEKFAGVVKALEENTGKKIEWHFPTSYASAIESHRRGFLHIVYYGPRSYVLASEKTDGNVEAFAMPVWGTGPYRDATQGYHSYVIVRADSPYKKVEDLKGKVIALTGPASTSGDLIPRVELGKRFGIRIDKYFGKLFHAGGHDAAALAVKEGRADAATVADITLDWGVDKGKHDAKTFRILWRSSLLPMDPFAWRKDLLSKGLKEKIKKAMLSLNTTEYGKEFLKQTRSTSVVLLDDSAYDPFRIVYKELKKWQ